MQPQQIKNNYSKPVQQINIDKNVTIVLTPVEVSTVVAYLRKGVYEQVASTINSIENQVINQMVVKEKVEVKDKVEVKIEEEKTPSTENNEGTL